MSILFSSANGVIDSTPVATYPFTLAAWFWTDATAHEAPIVGLFNSASGTDWATLGIGGGKVQLRCRSSASNQVLESAAAYTTGAWHAVVAVFESANLRTLYVDSAAAVTQTTAVTPAGLNRIGFGRYLDSTPSGNFAGRAGMICLWNAALTAKETAQYRDGQSPFSIRSSALLSLWDGRSSNPGRDIRGKRVPTWTAIATHDSEPPVSALLQIYSGVTKPQIPAAAGLFIANDSPIVETRAPVVLAAGKAQQFSWTIDPTTRTAKVRVNGGAWQSAGYQDVLKAVQGNAVIGLPLVDGVPTGTSNNFILNSMALFDRQLTATEWDTVDAEFGKMIPPVVPNVTAQATVGHVSDLKLLDDAEDAAGEGLRIVSVTQPAGAAVTIKDADAGIVSYDAKTLPTGTKNSFSFVTTNKFFKPTTATATCNVTIAALQPPVLESATTAADTTVGTAITLDVLAAATDPAGRPMVINSVSTPTNGGTAAIVSGKIKYTPKAGYTGADSFTYVIKNDWNASVTGTINVTVAAASAGVLKAYDFLGMNYAGGQQGDISSNSYSYRFSAAADGKLTHVTRFNQGARPNWEWKDTHAVYPYGKYETKVYKVASIDYDSSGQDAVRTLVGACKYPYFPGTRWGGFDGRSVPPNQDNTANGNTAGQDYHIAAGPNGDVKGPAIQAYNTFYGYGNDSGETDAPSYWTTSIRYAGGSWPLYELYDTAGNLGIAVSQGDILVVDWDDTGSGYSHDNSCHCDCQPAPGVSGVSVPMDPALGAFFKNGTSRNREWRKLPHYGQKIGSTWYGLPHMLTPSNANGTDETKNANGSLTNQDAIVFYGSKYVREVFTPPVGYSKKFKKAWVHLVRFTGLTSDRKPKTSSNSYVLTSDGVPQLRIMKAELGKTTWSQVWPASGWADGPATGHFVAKSTVTVGVRGTSTGKPDKADMTRFGEWDFSGDITIEGGYHYAIEVRVSPSYTDTCFYISPRVNGYTRFCLSEDESNGYRRAGATALDWHHLWPCGGTSTSSKYTFNCAQKSTDSGATWQNPRSGYQGTLVFPISLEPS